MTAANITTRLVKEKTTDWINTSFPSKTKRLLKQISKQQNTVQPDRNILRAFLCACFHSFLEFRLRKTVRRTKE